MAAPHNPKAPPLSSIPMSLHLPSISPSRFYHFLHSFPMASSSSSGGDPSDGYRHPDRMVKIELDAARTLAGFAHLALLESEHKRQRDPGESSSLSNAPRMEGNVPSRTFFFDLNQHASVFEEQGNDVVAREKKLQTPEDSPLFTIATLDCPSSSQLPASGCSRARHNQTEAEKEAKRLRRILANRESARQTIRRRQAFREELTKKADGLSKDNEIMKKEKERMVREYLLLKDINRQLKQKIAQRSNKVEEEEMVSPSEMSCTQLDPSSSSAVNTNDQSSTNLGFEEGGGVVCFPHYPWLYHVRNQEPGSRSCASEVREDGSLPLDKGSKTTNSSIKKKENESNAATTPTTISLATSFLGSSAGGGHRSLGNPKTTQLESYNVQTEPREQADALPPSKGTDVTGAADARKRRKQLTKWKKCCGLQQQ